MEIIHSGLPIYYNEVTGELEMKEGLTCKGHSKKLAGQMIGLWKDSSGLDEEDKVYDAYREIVFPNDKEEFQKYDYRYDITVIHPGTVNGEYKKTSGHYHGYIAQEVYTYPEVYEVIQGEIIFILLKVNDFIKREEPVIEEIIALHVKAGQSIIIPPGYGHGSVNPTNEVAMFSNIAVGACPLHYEPIQVKHGLPVYVMKADNSFRIVPNDNYTNAPKAKLLRPRENKSLGIEFGSPCYTNFIKHPMKYDFLLHPARYVEEINKMYHEGE